MNGLDSPLEALALTPVNLNPLFAVVFNNIWAFLAVVTSAVITIWHLRPSVAKTVLTQHVTEILHETVLQQSLISNVINEEVDEEEEEEEENVVLTRGNSKKFFTVFYEEGDNEEGYNCGDDVDCGDVEEEEVVIMKWETETELTELTVENEMRGGELGWYEFQDRMVIDGSVVRLWDGCGKRKCSSPKGVTLPFRGYYRCTSL
ncbi:uncharacterized protein LOC141597127 [Silene latifolia]|uniref:uncharacterized protein LOC141597127 n=1 Tax=Silene latifolia TaxID=37657 RepID=UPI003D780002